LARSGKLPNGQEVYVPVPGYNPAVAPYFNLWPEPNGPELLVNGLPTGTALAYSNPPNPVREDFDPSAFSLPIAGTYGDVGRNVLIGPGLEDVDLSLVKTMPVNERANLEFRAEFFNALNHTNFGLPKNIVLTTSGTPASSAGLISTTATDAREIQFGAKIRW
jgi:hypothetical protein